MGVPIGPRNIFPSNIQGLPTWYEVRVSEAGFLGARGGRRHPGRLEPANVRAGSGRARTRGLSLLRFDPADCTSLDPRRYYRLGHAADRDLHGPLRGPKTAPDLQNIVYVGALAALPEIELGVIETLLRERFKGKDKLTDANLSSQDRPR
jgi:2-oxoglutarate/2-oxoacid ferredoxin oxidoreductase subunit alpha